MALENTLGISYYSPVAHAGHSEKSLCALRSQRLFMFKWWRPPWKQACSNRFSQTQHFEADCCAFRRKTMLYETKSWKGHLRWWKFCAITSDGSYALISPLMFLLHTMSSVHCVFAYSVLRLFCISSSSHALMLRGLATIASSTKTKNYKKNNKPKRKNDEPESSERTLKVKKKRKRKDDTKMKNSKKLGWARQLRRMMNEKRKNLRRKRSGNS